MAVPPVAPALNPPVSTPFSPFAPPQSPTLANPLQSQIPALDPMIPPGPPDPNMSVLNTVMDASPSAAQTPFGGSANPTAPTAPGGADYMQASPNVLGDSPYRRVKRGEMQGLTMGAQPGWGGGGTNPANTSATAMNNTVGPAMPQYPEGFRPV